MLYSRVIVNSDEDAKALTTIQDSGLYDFWTDVKRTGFVDIMVNPELEATLRYGQGSLSLIFKIDRGCLIAGNLLM